MKLTLITGGTGFVGRHLTRHRPEDMLYYTLSKSQWNLGPLTWPDDVDYVIHAAPVDPAPAIEFARSHDAVFMYVSSGCVLYPNYRNQYRKDKLAGERKTIQSGLDWRIARLFTFAGSSVMWRTFFEQAMNGEPLTLHVPPVTRSFCTGREMAEQMWAVLLKGKCGAYQIGSDRAVRADRFAERLAGFANVGIERMATKPPMPHYLPGDLQKTKDLL